MTFTPIQKASMVMNATTRRVKRAPASSPWHLARSVPASLLWGERQMTFRELIYELQCSTDDNVISHPPSTLASFSGFSSFNTFLIVNSCETSSSFHTTITFIYLSRRCACYKRIKFYDTRTLPRLGMLEIAIADERKVMQRFSVRMWRRRSEKTLPNERRWRKQLREIPLWASWKVERKVLSCDHKGTRVSTWALNPSSSS
jgi:hypothetical protein